MVRDDPKNVPQKIQDAFVEIEKWLNALAFSQVQGQTSMQSPTLARGDMIYRPQTGPSAKDTRLPIGSTGEVLTVVGGLPNWEPAAGGGAPVDATYITQIPNATLTNEQAISLLASGILLGTFGTGIITSLPFPGGTSTFLRADATFATVTAVASISQVEVDFGEVPVSEGFFRITDANVSLSSRILAQVAYIAPTNKDLDEIEMDDLQIRCAPGSGTFDMFIQAANGSYLADKFVVFYQVGA